MNTTTNLLPVFDTMQSAWNSVRGSKRVFWTAFSIYLVCDIAEALFGNSLYTDIPFKTIMIDTWALIGIFQLFLILQCIDLGIRRARGLPINFYSSLNNVLDLKLLLNMLGLIFLASFFVVVPTTILALLPTLVDSLKMINGILLGLFSAFCYILAALSFMLFFIRTSLSYAVCITQRMGPIMSITISIQATQSNVFRIASIFILNVLIFFITVFPLGIGLVWSLPYIIISYGMMYNILVKANNQNRDRETPSRNKLSRSENSFIG